MISSKMVSKPYTWTLITYGLLLVTPVLADLQHPPNSLHTFPSQALPFDPKAQSNSIVNRKKGSGFTVQDDQVASAPPMPQDQGGSTRQNSLDSPSTGRSLSVEIKKGRSGFLVHGGPDATAPPMPTQDQVAQVSNAKSPVGPKDGDSKNANQAANVVTSAQPSIGHLRKSNSAPPVLQRISSVKASAPAMPEHEKAQLMMQKAASAPLASKRIVFDLPPQMQHEASAPPMPGQAHSQPKKAPESKSIASKIRGIVTSPRHQKAGGLKQRLATAWPARLKQGHSGKST